MTTRTTTIQCPDCKGDGRVSDGWLDYTRCERCEGHGRLSVPVCECCKGRGHHEDEGKPTPRSAWGLASGI